MKGDSGRLSFTAPPGQAALTLFDEGGEKRIIRNILPRQFGMDKHIAFTIHQESVTALTNRDRCNLVPQIFQSRLGNPHIKNDNNLSLGVINGIVPGDVPVIYYKGSAGKALSLHHRLIYRRIFWNIGSCGPASIFFSHTRRDPEQTSINGLKYRNRCAGQFSYTVHQAVTLGTILVADHDGMNRYHFCITRDLIDS